MTIETFSKKYPNNEFTLVTDSQDVKAVAEHLAKTRTFKNRNIDGLVVQILDGEYGHVYGFQGIIPYYHKSLFKLN